MRLAATLVALAAAAICAASASAESAERSPLTLVLQRSDFPAKTRWSAARYPATEKSLAAFGFQAKVAEYHAEIPRGSTDTLFVGGRVMVLASAAEARRLFAGYKQDPALRAKLARTVRLAAYGDEQSAFVQSKLGTRADLRVRSGAVVWRVEIKWGGVETFTGAQALAELQIYAAKLKRRVGTG
jgi:hypothetical protein